MEISGCGSLILRYQGSKTAAGVVGDPWKINEYNTLLVEAEGFHVRFIGIRFGKPESGRSADVHRI